VVELMAIVTMPVAGGGAAGVTGGGAAGASSPPPQPVNEMQAASAATESHPLAHEVFMCRLQ
jgi:hypothetical protein